MSSDNLKIASRYLRELWSEGRIDRLRDLVASSCIVRDPMIPAGAGIDGLAAHVRGMRAAFPDLKVTVDRVVVESGPQIAIAWTATGTHRRGAWVDFDGMLLLRFADARLVAISCYWEPGELFRQVKHRLARGSMPMPLPTSYEMTDVDAGWTS